MRNAAAEVGGHTDAAIALASKGSSGLLQLLDSLLPTLASSQPVAGAVNDLLMSLL